MSLLKILASLLLLAVAGCAASSARGGASETYAPDQTLERARSRDTPDAREYAALDAAYRNQDHQELQKRSREFLKRFPESEFTAQVYNLRGLSFIARKDYPAALSQLKKVTELAGSGGLATMAAYNMGFIHFETGQLDRAAEQLDGLTTAALDPPNRVKFHVLRAKIARVRQDPASSAREILMAMRYAPEGAVQKDKAPMLSFLDDALESMSDLGALEGLLADFEESPAADRLLFKVGRYYFAGGQRDKSKPYFERITKSFPESRYYADAVENLRKIDFQGVVESRKIGAVLTLSGKFGKVGYKALQGIELAFKVFQPKGSRSAKSLSLVVMDDQGDPERAVAVMEELFYKHHVIGVIGPLVSKLADAMAKKAQELGLPLITLTQKEVSGGDYVFNAGLTPSVQVKELLQYASAVANVRHFAMLAPSSRFGEEYTRAFWDELDRRQGIVRGYETYPQDETDFRAYVDNLAGLSQPDARSREVEELRELKASTPVKVRSKKFDRLFELKPIVDFEAVFIPDEPKVLGQLLPTFAYRDIENVLFLGINTWNSPELLARAAHFSEGSVFVDGFFSGSKKPGVRKFIEDYQRVFKSEPGPVEALAYDAASILESTLAGGDFSARSDLRDRIAGLQGFPGVTGKISYQSGRLVKRLHLLTVRNGKIEEIAFQ